MSFSSNNVTARGTETNHQPGPKVLLQMLKYKTMLIILKGDGGKCILCEQPVAGGYRSYSDIYRPYSDTYRDTYRPYRDTYRPYSDTYRPYSDTYRPYSDTYRPYSDTHRPYSDTYRPYSDIYRPYSKIDIQVLERCMKQTSPLRL